MTESAVMVHAGDGVAAGADPRMASSKYSRNGIVASLTVRIRNRVTSSRHGHPMPYTSSSARKQLRIQVGRSSSGSVDGRECDGSGMCLLFDKSRSGGELQTGA